jgi:predicted transcriptional regulator
MNATAETIRGKVHTLADHLPEQASWDDVLEEVRFLKAVDEGIAAADREEFASEEEVKSAFRKWGVKVES